MTLLNKSMQIVVVSGFQFVLLSLLIERARKSSIYENCYIASQILKFRERITY
jgi:hypothetical protein